MSNKLSWKKILVDFKRRHPHLAKQVSYWCPNDYMSILVYLKDGTKLTYNYSNSKATIVLRGSEFK